MTERTPEKYSMYHCLFYQTRNGQRTRLVPGLFRSMSWLLISRCHQKTQFVFVVFQRVPGPLL